VLTIKTYSALAQALTQLRHAHGLTGPCSLNLQDARALESALRCTIPDCILAYVAAGSSAWTGEPLSLQRIQNLTLAFRKVLKRCACEAHGLQSVIVFDLDAQGNYVAFKRNAASSQCVLLIDRRNFNTTEVSLTEAVLRYVTGQALDHPYLDISKMGTSTEFAVEVTTTRQCSWFLSLILSGIF